LKYFKYEFKKSLWPIIILTVLGALVYIPTLISADFTLNNSIFKQDTRLGLMGVYLSIVCTLVPVYEFSFLMKKRSIDEFFAMPIKRINIMACRFISGYVKILISYAIVYFAGMFVVFSKVNDFYMIHYLPYFFYSSLLGLALYAFNSFIFTRANTTVDGIIFIILYIFMFSLVYTSIIQMVRDFHYVIKTDLSFAFPYTPIINLTGYYNRMIQYGTIDPAIEYLSINRFNFSTSYTLWSIIGVLSLAGLFCGALFDKAERAEQISDSYFGYRIVIPLYLVMIYYTIQMNPFQNGLYFVIHA
jgi:ABC-type transport system involved in multi-copper enzyme maturation permease subunit